MVELVALILIFFAYLVGYQVGEQRGVYKEWKRHISRISRFLK